MILAAYVGTTYIFGIFANFVLTIVFSRQGNYCGCAWSTYSLLHTPGFFVHSWELLLGDEIYPYYVSQLLIITPFND